MPNIRVVITSLFQWVARGNPVFQKEDVRVWQYPTLGIATNPTTIKTGLGDKTTPQQGLPANGLACALFLVDRLS
ncbi:hypothetical protein [Robbsia andropogonis]|uniref:hypothetical protein n=1 Tax=Robbsia andropogonis TaxID=28092 RepID=UPI0004B6C439|nr:hypothetical protein [Robbsia andropogonis]MCP1117244.1 hypothetical protein [Robbsia andropogonis]MCP1129362.1 hypothetical protein [Robbsia andropogonis]